MRGAGGPIVGDDLGLQWSHEVIRTTEAVHERNANDDQ